MGRDVQRYSGDGKGRGEHQSASRPRVLGFPRARVFRIFFSCLRRLHVADLLPALQGSISAAGQAQEEKIGRKRCSKQARKTDGEPAVEKTDNAQQRAHEGEEGEDD